MTAVCVLIGGQSCSDNDAPLNSTLLGLFVAVTSSSCCNPAVLSSQRLHRASVAPSALWTLGCRSAGRRLTQAL